MKETTLSPILTVPDKTTDLDIKPPQKSLENNANVDIVAVLELANRILAFYKNPETQPTWIQVNEPLPAHVSLYLQNVADHVNPVNQAFGKSKPVNNERRAALFFVRKVLLIEGADHFRILGLQAPASQSQIYNNYRNLSRLHFHQQKSEQDHTSEMRILEAYNVLQETPDNTMIEKSPFFEISVELELAVDIQTFYKKPETQPLWMQASQVLPDHIPLYLQYVADQINQANLILSDAEGAENGKNKQNEKLISSALFFVRRVLLAEGANHFRVLGLDPSATLDQIQDNYRNLRRLHWKQEKSGQDQSVVMRISQAYVVLRDPQAKKAYSKEVLRHSAHFTIDDDLDYTRRRRQSLDVFGDSKKPSKLMILMMVCGLFTIAAGGWWFSVQERGSTPDESVAVIPAIEEISTTEITQDGKPVLAETEVIDSASDNSNDDGLIERLENFVNAPITVAENSAGTASKQEVAENTQVFTEPVNEATETSAVGRHIDAQEKTANFIEVMRLIAKAEKQVTRSRLTKPKGDNAYDTYLKILEKDPGNREATRGLQRIAQKYQVLAKDWLKKEKYASALRMVLRGLDVVPDYEPLLALDVKIKEAMELTETGGRLEPDAPFITKKPSEVENDPAPDITQPLIKEPVTESRVQDNVATSEQNEQDLFESNVNNTGDLTLVELDRILADFVVLYGKGELQPFLNLFSEEVRTNNGATKAALEKDYRSLFDSTFKRLIRLQDVRWNIESREAMGEADFKLTIMKRNEEIPRSYEGSLTFEVVKTDRIIITGLYHSQQKVER